MSTRCMRAKFLFGLFVFLFPTRKVLPQSLTKAKSNGTQWKVNEQQIILWLKQLHTCLCNTSIRCNVYSTEGTVCSHLVGWYQLRVRTFVELSDYKYIYRGARMNQIRITFAAFPIGPIHSTYYCWLLLQHTVESENVQALAKTH